MSHLTNLVLCLQNFRVGDFSLKYLYLSELIAVDITCDSEPIGLALTEFIAHHTDLLRLHLRFKSFGVNIPAAFLPHLLPKLRAFKFYAENSWTYTRWLIGKDGIRQPYLEHLFIEQLRSSSFNRLEPYIRPLGSPPPSWPTSSRWWVRIFWRISRLPQYIHCPKRAFYCDHLKKEPSTNSVIPLPGTSFVLLYCQQYNNWNTDLLLSSNIYKLARTASRLELCI